MSKQKIILKHRDCNVLAQLGDAIMHRWHNEIGSNVNFDQGNLSDLTDTENREEPRMPCLELVCPNAVSGEIIMLCIRLPGVQMDLKPLEIE